MKKFALPVIAIALLVSGCYGAATARFYPVRGPLTQQAPAPVLVGTLTETFNSGSIKLVLENGEVCKGHWSPVPRPSRTESGTTSKGTAEDMSAVWDEIYGSGFYVARVLGSRRYAAATAVGNHGTKVYVEIYEPESEPHETDASRIRGVAKDSIGNVYKITFENRFAI